MAHDTATTKCNRPAGFLLLLLAFGLNGIANESDEWTFSDWNNRGSTLFASFRYKEAEGYFVRALTAADARGGARPDQLAVIHTNLAEVYRAQGRYAEAETAYRRAIEFSEHLPPESAYSRSALRGMARLYSMEGRFAEAEAFARRALALKVAQGVTEWPLPARGTIWRRSYSRGRNMTIPKNWRCWRSPRFRPRIGPGKPRPATHSRRWEESG